MEMRSLAWSQQNEALPQFHPGRYECDNAVPIRTCLLNITICNAPFQKAWRCISTFVPEPHFAEEDVAHSRDRVAAEVLEYNIVASTT